MTDDEDREALDLCRALCTRAGMVFEDASAKAILIDDVPAGELQRVVGMLEAMTEQAASLLAAAAALVGD